MASKSWKASASLSPPRNVTVVLGLGDPLRGDEGVGVHAARALADAGMGRGVEVLDAGSALFDTLCALRQAERVILVDAIRAGGPPGTVYRMPLEEFSRNECVASMGGFDVERALALSGRARPPEIVVVGVEPATMGWSPGLSPQVAQALDRVVETIRAEVCAPGARLETARTAVLGEPPLRR